MTSTKKRRNSPLQHANEHADHPILCQHLLHAVEIGHPLPLLEEQYKNLMSTAKRCLRSVSSSSSKDSNNLVLAIYCLYRCCHLSSVVDLNEDVTFSLLKLCYHAATYAYNAAGSGECRQMYAYAVVVYEAAGYVFRNCNFWFVRCMSVAEVDGRLITNMPVPLSRKRVFRLDEKAWCLGYREVASKSSSEWALQLIKLIANLNIIVFQSYVGLVESTVLSNSEDALSSLDFLKENRLKTIFDRFSVSRGGGYDNIMLADLFRFSSVVVVPWLGAYLSVDGIGKDCINVCATNAIKLHRSLWGFAQKIEAKTKNWFLNDRSEERKLSDELPNEISDWMNSILPLRMEANCSLLLIRSPNAYRYISCISKTEAMMVPSSFIVSSEKMYSIFEKHLEMACTYAWRDAAIFEQWSKKVFAVEDLQSIIETYYVHCDEILFLVVSSYINAVKESNQRQRVPAFLEYCIRRMLHRAQNGLISVSNTKSDFLPRYLKSSSKLMEGLRDEVGINILFIINIAVRTLRETNNFDEIHLVEEQLSSCYQSIQKFEQQDILRSYRMLSFWKVTSSLFKFSLNSSTSCPEKIYVSIYFISLMMEYSFIPVCCRIVWGTFQLSDKNADLVKISSDCDGANLQGIIEQHIDGLLKVVMGYEHLQTYCKTKPVNLERKFGQSINQVRLALRLCSSSKMLEYAGKSLGAIASRLLKDSRSVGSLLSLISIDSLSRLPKGRLHVCNFSQRCIKIAATMNQYDRVSQSLIILRLCLNLELMNSRFENNRSINILASNGTYRHEVLDEVVLQIVNVLFSKSQRLHFVDNDEGLELNEKLMIESLEEKLDIVNNEWHISRDLHNILMKGHKSLSEEKIDALLLNATWHFGRKVVEMSMTSKVANDAEDMLIAFDKFIEDIFRLGSCRNKACILTIAARSLQYVIPRKDRNCSGNILARGLDYALRARAIVLSDEISDLRPSELVVARAASTLLVIECLDYKRDVKLLSELTHYTKMIINQADLDLKTSQNSIISFIPSFLSRLQTQYFYIGAIFPTVKISAITIGLYSTRRKNVSISPLCDAFLEGDLFDFSYGNEERKEDDSNSVNRLLHIESILTQLIRYLYVDTNFGSNLEIELREVQIMLQDLSTCLNENELMEILCEPNHCQWLVSCCLLGLAEVEERKGNLPRTLKYLRSSAEVCRQTLSSKNKSLTSNLEYSHYNYRWVARLSKCMQLLAQVTARMGDRSRAEAYANASIKILMPMESEENFGLFTNINLSRRESESKRLRWELKSYTDDQFTCRYRSQFEKKIATLPFELNDIHSIDMQIEEAYRLVSLGDIERRLSNSNSSLYIKYYRKSGEILQMLLNIDVDGYFCDCIQTKEENENMFKLQTKFGRLQCTIKLRLARCAEKFPNQDFDFNPCDIYKEICSYPSASGLDRSYAYYRLGRISLQDAKANGNLQNLWKRNDDDSFLSGLSFGRHFSAVPLGTPNSNYNEERNTYLRSEPLSDARKYFREALNYAGSSTQQLTKNILRCLALVTGPERFDELTGLPESFILMHKSLGAAHRNALASDLQRSHDLGNTIVALDDNENKFKATFDLLGEVLPLKWNVVALSLCPSGEILCSVLRQSEKRSGGLDPFVTCIFPSEKELNGKTSFKQMILHPLNEILEENQKQLNAISVDDHSNDKQRWWEQRLDLDSKLAKILSDIEHHFFSKDILARLFTTPASTGVTAINLAEKFEEVLRLNEDEVEEKEHILSLKVVELKAALDEIGVKKREYRGMRKAELQNLLIEKKSKQRTSTSIANSNHEGTEEEVSETGGCTMLVLDENLHRIPWESLCFLSNLTICRLPSLPFILTSINFGKRHPMVNPENITYILDPESNLTKTKDTIKPFIDGLMARFSCEWTGVVGEMPSTSFIEDSLLLEDGLLLYCGHGGGQKCFSRPQIDSFNKSDKRRKLRNRGLASIILMGCSSGRLNGWDSKHEITGLTQTYYEPSGIAMSYLYAGSPCVVGNLWDVTDRDIDRFFVKVMDKFLNPECNARESLAKCISTSRSACKLRYLVGSAPVCYGIPVELLNQ